jgi:ZIP family zinc transporter
MSALWAGFWGLVGGVSLLIGAVIGLYAKASQRTISFVMALGAGVLISSVAFELMEEAYKVGGFDAAAVGLVAGSVVYFAADLTVNWYGARHRKRSQGQQQGSNATAIAVGALLDGIPESVAIGVSLLRGGTVSWVMVAAVFLSNVPESLSSAAGMKKAGRSARHILGLWTAVLLASGLAALLGNLLLRGAGGNTIGGIQAFAAGAILTMLSSTMMPEAYESGGAVVGLITSAGFLLAFILSHLQ